MDEIRVKTLLDIGVSGADIMHGYLKELIYDTQCLQETAEHNKDYLEGRIDALCDLYDLTYKIAFNEKDR